MDYKKLKFVSAVFLGGVGYSPFGGPAGDGVYPTVPAYLATGALFESLVRGGTILDLSGSFSTPQPPLSDDQTLRQYIKDVEDIAVAATAKANAASNIVANIVTRQQLEAAIAAIPPSTGGGGGVTSQQLQDAISNFAANNNLVTVAQLDAALTRFIASNEIVTEDELVLALNGLGGGGGSDRTSVLAVLVSGATYLRLQSIDLRNF